MADLATRLREAAEAVAPELSDGELHLLSRRTERRLRRRARLRMAGGAAIALLLAGSLVRVALERGTADGDLAEVEVSRTGEVAVSGASGVSEVLTLEVSAGETRLQLARGAARFSVAPQGPRRVRVVAGDVTVEVVGTTFVVERRARAVRVAVDEGTVRLVRAGTVLRLVRAGEVALVGEAEQELVGVPGAPPPGVSGAPPASPVPVESAGALVTPALEPSAEPSAVALPSAPGRGRPARAAGDWRALAQRGDFRDAWTALERTAPRDEPEDLLRAADVARLSGHPRRALAPLERVVGRFPDDARAPLAAFTLGRVLLEELGRPERAAAAFARARALAPRGPLAADALARQAESLARAGALHEARVLAREYLAAYPGGARAAAMRRWVDPP